MKELSWVWFRAFGIVTCTALNVVQVSHRHFLPAFFTGSLLSFIWWANTRTASSSNAPGAQAAYAFGAGCGTVFGMWLGGLWGR